MFWVFSIPLQSLKLIITSVLMVYMIPAFKFERSSFYRWIKGVIPYRTDRISQI